MMDNIETIARYRGCLLGLAVGDALGTTLEFKAPGSFKPIDDMLGGGPFHLAPGEWTDDTSMALCLAESLIECGKFDALDQLERYLRWQNEGYLSHNQRCFDIGNTVRHALRTYEAQKQMGGKINPNCGPTDPHTAGNGSLMRLAPAAMFFAPQPLVAAHMCAQSSLTTHGAQAAIDACFYFGTLLAFTLNGAPKEMLLQVGYTPWLEELHPPILEVAHGSFQHKQPPEIQGSGYVVKSLEAAMWAFNNSQDFRQGCLMAANLGDDADTTAAIYGQLAGAYYGEEGIPAEWLEKLAMREQIEEYAIRLYELSRQFVKEP
jgi:ADP-ribosylglycohydrolase